MADSTEANITKILQLLAKQPRHSGSETPLTGEQIRRATGLDPGPINDAVALLDSNGLVERLQTLGTAPFSFRQVEITPRGRYELERATKESEQSQPRPIPATPPPVPIGSPFGFTDLDFEQVAEQRAKVDALYVVLGCQFESDYYDRGKLRDNVNSMFAQAVTEYNARPNVSPLSLYFKPLVAGLGEHLFNEIARDIIGADIAVFETSDLNPNVMLELGVALTWGVRVLPIMRRGCAKPPSDISGQTWAEYEEHAATFADPGLRAKLVGMVERAVRKKGHR